MTAEMSIDFVITETDYSLCLFLRKAESDFFFLFVYKNLICLHLDVYLFSFWFFFL